MKNSFLPILFLAVVFSGISCNTSTDSCNIVTVMETVDIGVLYAGIDNPVKIAASGVQTSEISVSIDNGTISGEKGEYIITPNKEGTLNLTVSNNGTEIHKRTIRVEKVPDPFVGVLTSSGFIPVGRITKSQLLEAGGITVKYPDWFPFNVNYEMVHFELSTILGEYDRVISTNSASFTKEMIDLIKGAKKDQIFDVCVIIAVGPDGQESELCSLFIIVSN